MQATGGVDGPDCLFAIFLRVLPAKVKGHIVISFFFLGLHVIVHETSMKRGWARGSLPVSLAN
jgi:hypothetical protein